MSRFLILSLICIICSCKNSTVTEVEENGNVTTFVSTDISKLRNVIGLKKYKPTSVKFKYTFINNSGRDVSGPSDSFLEAVLYFDEKTMKEIRNIDQNADFPIPDFYMEEFKFSWLDKSTISELENSGKVCGHPDFLFGTVNGKCWYLKNKILFVSQST